MPLEKSSTQYYERKIRRAVLLFIVGCIAFVALESVLIYLGYFTVTNPQLEWPRAFVLLGVAGLYLLWEMIMALRFRSDLPGNYEKVETESQPFIHRNISEVAAALGLPMPRTIYLSSGIEAAVFCRPTMLSIFRRPRPELVIGRILLKFLTEEELKAILYHEFGHYCSRSLDKKTPTYMVAQFAKSFTAVKKMDRQGAWDNVIKSQIALFSDFSFWICARIGKYYQEISLAEEYAADDVARACAGDLLLAKTLVKVSVLQYNLKYLTWALRQMKTAGAVDENLILYYLCRYNKVTVGQAISRQVQSRLSRLNYRLDKRSAVSADSCEEHRYDRLSPERMLSMRIARSLQASHCRYAEAKALSRSVTLHIHLDHKKHRLPLVDGKYHILLDGKKVGAGNFIKGYDLNVRTSPGRHVIETYAVSGIRTIPLEIDCVKDAHYQVEMDFRVHLRGGYYDVYATSAQLILSHSERSREADKEQNPDSARSCS